MGLDCHAFKNAKLKRKAPDGVPPSGGEYDLAYIDGDEIIYFTDFPERLDGQPKGVYSGERLPSFRAGSYGGYNRWREKLSQMAIGVDPQTVWDNWKKYKDEPFALLIHFSDCEGAIGPESSLILHGQFEAWREQARDEMDRWEFEVYEDFAKAFEEVAGNGFVVFH